VKEASCEPVYLAVKVLVAQLEMINSFKIGL